MTLLNPLDVTIFAVAILLSDSDILFVLFTSMHYLLFSFLEDVIEIIGYKNFLLGTSAFCQCTLKNYWVSIKFFGGIERFFTGREPYKILRTPYQGC